MGQVGQPVTYYQKWDFVVEIAGVAVGGFTSCKGLEKEHKVAEQMEGGAISVVAHATTTVAYPDITLERGGSDNNELYLWSENQEQGIQDLRDVSIVQQRGGIPVVRYNCESCVLKKYTAPEFDRKAEEENVVESIVIKPLRWKKIDLA